MNDIRYAFRMLGKSPGFTAVAVLSLAFGIGANTTAFCWIQNVLLRPVSGVVACERLAALVSTHGALTIDTVSLPDLRDYAGLTDVFSGVIGSQVTPACLTLEGKSEWVYGQIATANFFEVLGVRPLLGRAFLAKEDQSPRGNPVLVISHGFWQRRFGANPGIVGTTVELNQTSFTIVGVAPPLFLGTMSGLSCDFWAPVSMHEPVANFGSLLSREDRWLHTQARLKPGVNIRQAQAAVNLLAGQLEKAFPATNQEFGIRVLPLWQAPYGAQALMLPVLRILMAVSFGVLLIVSANVANLLLARAVGRRKEIAIRLAVGAKRMRLIRQLLTESLLLAAVGGACGILFANWGVTIFSVFMPNSHLPIAFHFGFDRQTLGFTLLVALATGVVFGLVPALQSASSHLSEVLKEGGRSGSVGLAHHRIRSAFVVSEVALALLLLVGAGLCLKGFQKARQVELGFNPRNLLLAGLRIGMNGYDRTNGLVFYRRLHERLSSLPGVRHAALASWFPLGFEGGPRLPVQPEGYVRRPNEDISVSYSIISPDYFGALQIPILEGRDFRDTDDQEARKVAIINETMAKRFWPGQNPVGRKFTIWRGEMTVVGVVKGGKYRSLNEAPKEFFYLPYRQGAWDLNLGVVLRCTGDPVAFTAPLRDTIHSLDPAVEVWANLPMLDYIEAAFLAQRIAATLLSGLGIVALILAAMGIYGVMAYAVSQRTQEIGIRMALGAQIRDVVRLILGQGMVLGGIGVSVGLAGAFVFTRLMSSFLYGVSPFDPWIFFGMSAALGGVTFLASFIPARRAARVDPQVALRYE
ncbi:MAG: ABC transporter permease [Verrucomicrobiota bacterium]